ncbi:MAG: hypothetical protein GTO14_15220 [Anaerolineales bacterium]|nr:hypothetical protein [Anaerolineales bacterium]
MRHFKSDRLISRNSGLAKGMLYTGLGVLVVSLVFSLVQRENVTQPVILAIIGLMLSQIGMPLYNRWARRPRMDEIFDAALKGLDNRYALFHYALGTNHALVGPAGIFALIPRIEEGEISFSEGKWWRQVENPGFLRRAGKKEIKNIAKEAAGEMRALERTLKRIFPDQRETYLDAIVVFLHKDADVKVVDSPIVSTHIKKIKNVVRRLPKGKSFDVDEIEHIADILKL